MTDYGRSLIRTFVPLVVGSLVAWLASRGVKVDQSALLPAVDAIVAAAYYGVIRWAETRWPKAGWLLGAPGAPSYAATSSLTGITVAPPAAYIAEDETLSGIPDPNASGTLRGTPVNEPGQPKDGDSAHG